jgi:hypothetical protein
MMRALGSIGYKDLSVNSPVFDLHGGIYQIVAVFGAGGISAQLMELGPDGVTYLSASDPLIANGGCTIYLPPGQYYWAINGTNVSVGALRVPGE